MPFSTNMTEHSRLREREKELACVYAISHVAASEMEEREALETIAAALIKSLQFENAGFCRIETAETEVELGAVGEPEEYRIASERPGIRLELRYRGRVPAGFLAEERALLDSTADICVGIVSNARLIKELREAGERMASKNAALRELIALIEEERRDTANTVERNARRAALPLVEKLRDPLLSPEAREAYSQALVMELEQLSRPFSLEQKSAASPAAASLSLRERDVIRLLRAGKTSKEIAGVLGLSAATIERHRHNIRKKLGLVGSDANLAGVLLGDGI